VRRRGYEEKAGGPGREGGTGPPVGGSTQSLDSESTLELYVNPRRDARLGMSITRGLFETLRGYDGGVVRWAVALPRPVSARREKAGIGERRGSHVIGGGA